MAKIIGNPTVTPMAVPDWNQTDETKADYIKNKPYIGYIDDINAQLQQYTKPGVYGFIASLSDDSLLGAANKVYLLIVNGNEDKIGTFIKTTLSQYILDCESNSIILERMGQNDNIYNPDIDEYEILWSWGIFTKSSSSGGGGNIIVDQTYSPNSENAQSGKAVAEALADIQISGGSVQSDWDEESSKSMAYIKNKPTIPESISQLDDDTEAFPINMANEAVRSIQDMYGNPIHIEYATKKEVETVESIAKGRAAGYVFDTYEDMILWLQSLLEGTGVADGGFLNLGDNFYIRATNVPDYWWDGSAAQPLETQKVDLTEYVKNTDYATGDKAGVIKVARNGDYGVYNAGDNIIRLYGATTNDIKDKLAQTRAITPHNLEYAVEVCTNQDINAELTESQLKLPPSTQFLNDKTSKVGELIDEIVIEEEGLSSISRHSANYKMYNFKAMYVDFEVKPCNVQQTIQILFYDGETWNKSNQLGSYQASCTVATAGRFVTAAIDVYAGKWFVIGNATTIQGSPTTIQSWRDCKNYQGETIKSILIKSAQGTSLEVGSKIKIYGVR